MRMHKLAVIPGDGIGPEVVSAGLAVLEAAVETYSLGVQTTELEAGAKHYLSTGELWDDGLGERLRDYDGVIFGAMGDPSVPPGVLERGIILAMRAAFRQSVNVRPVRLYPGVVSPMRGVTPETCDLVIVRENTEGPYVGRGSTVHRGTPEAVAFQESVNTRAAIERAVDFSFRLARERRNKVTLCHKKNILIEAGNLWQETVNEVGERFPDVEHDYVHVDAMCFHLPMRPEMFDVVVTDNLFGDIITDLGAMVQGGLGLSASANLNLDGTAPSMFEPIHGSAPDIAGRGIADPTGTILSIAMCLASLGEREPALGIEAAMVEVLGTERDSAPSTQELGRAVADQVRRKAAPRMEPSVMAQLSRLRRSAPSQPMAPCPGPASG